jgi:two-component system, LytTR family, response regulator AlgR
MRVLIVDDEAPARERLRAMVEALAGHEVVGEGANGAEALDLAQRQHPDVVLMDIRMPGMDGLEAARHLTELDSPPAVIFTTAYDQHALAAFEAQAVDYLLKPIRKERLQDALERAVRLTRPQLTALQGRAPLAGGRTHICARIRGNLQLIPVAEIVYFMADQKYVSVRYLQGEVLIEEPLKALEEEFGARFLRIHRNALVAVPFLEGLEKDEDGRHLVRLRGVAQTLEVSRRHLPEVRQRLKDGVNLT